MMFRGKGTDNSKPKKCHVRFQADSDSSSNISRSNCHENKTLRNNSQGTFTYYLSKLTSIFTARPRQSEEETEIGKPGEKTSNVARGSCTGSSVSLSDVSSRQSLESTSRESLEADFSPDKMSGDEQSAYHVVKSALKYGYASHIINRKDQVFWLRKFPTPDFNVQAAKKAEEDRLKLRKRRRPSKEKKKKRLPGGRKVEKADISTDSSSESILSSPYKICKIKCVSRK